MKTKGLSISQFSEAININKSIMSHVLNGRNKPSLTFVESILNAYPEIRTDWLLFGKGAMNQNDEIKKETFSPTSASTLNLFSELNTENETKIAELNNVIEELNRKIEIRNRENSDLQVTLDRIRTTNRYQQEDNKQEPTAAIHSNSNDSGQLSILFPTAEVNIAETKTAEATNDGKMNDNQSREKINRETETTINQQPSLQQKVEKSGESCNHSEEKEELFVKKVIQVITLYSDGSCNVFHNNN